MDLIILLYFLHAIYKASVDAAVKSYGLAKGRDVAAGGRDYSGAGRSLGTVLGVFWQVLVEGWRTGRPWARQQAAEFRARRAAKRRTVPEPDWDAELDAPDDDETDDDDGVWRCARCGTELDEDSAVSFVEGRAVCASHLNAHCSACGQLPRVDDPLVLDGGYWTHRSHVADRDEARPVPDEPLGPPAAVASDWTPHAPTLVDTTWKTTTTEGAAPVTSEWSADRQGVTRVQGDRRDDVRWDSFGGDDLWSQVVAAADRGDAAESERLLRQVTDTVNDYLGIDLAGNPTVGAPTPLPGGQDQAELGASPAHEPPAVPAAPRLALVKADPPPAGGWASVRTHHSDGGA